MEKNALLEDAEITIIKSILYENSSKPNIMRKIFQKLCSYNLCHYASWNA